MTKRSITMKTRLLIYCCFWSAILAGGCSKSSAVDVQADFARTFSSLNPPSPVDLVDRIECWKFSELQKTSAIPTNIAEHAVLIYNAEGADARLRAKSIHEALLRQQTDYPAAPATDQYVLFVYRKDGLKIAFRVTTYSKGGVFYGADFIVLKSSVRHIDNAGIRSILFREMDPPASTEAKQTATSDLSKSKPSANQSK